MNPLSLCLCTSIPCSIWRILSASCLDSLEPPLAERTCFSQARDTSPAGILAALKGDSPGPWSPDRAPQLYIFYAKSL